MMLTKWSQTSLCGVVKGMARVCKGKTKIIEVLPVKKYATQQKVASSKASLVILLEQFCNL